MPLPRQSMPLANRLEVPGLGIITTAVPTRRFSNPIPLTVAQVPRRISRDEVSRPPRVVLSVAALVLA